MYSFHVNSNCRDPTLFVEMPVSGNKCGAAQNNSVVSQTYFLSFITGVRGDIVAEWKKNSALTSVLAN